MHTIFAETRLVKYNIYAVRLGQNETRNDDMYTHPIGYAMKGYSLKVQTIRDMIEYLRMSCIKKTYLFSASVLMDNGLIWHSKTEKEILLLFYTSLTNHGSGRQFKQKRCSPEIEKFINILSSGFAVCSSRYYIWKNNFQMGKHFCNCE